MSTRILKLRKAWSLSAALGLLAYFISVPITSASFGILNNDITLVEFESDGGGSLSIWIPSAFDNSHAHSKIFGGGGFPPVKTLRRYDQRVDMYEQVIRHLCFQPHGDLIGMDERLKIIVEAAEEVDEAFAQDQIDALFFGIRVLDRLAKGTTTIEAIDKARQAFEVELGPDLHKVFSKLTDASEAYNKIPILKSVGPILAAKDVYDTASQLSALNLLYLALASDMAKERLDHLQHFTPIDGDSMAWNAAWNRVNHDFGEIQDGNHWVSLANALEESMPDVVNSGVGLASTIAVIAAHHPAAKLLLYLTKHAFVVYGQIYDFNYQLQYASVAASIYRRLTQEYDWDNRAWRENVQYVQYLFYDSLNEALRQTLLGAVQLKVLLTADFGSYSFMRDYYGQKRDIVARLSHFDFLGTPTHGGTASLFGIRKGVDVQETIGFAQRLVIRDRDSGVPLGLSAEDAMNMGRIIEAHLDISLAGLDADAQALLYLEYGNHRILLKEFPKTLKEDSTQFRVSIPVWALVQNHGNVRFAIEHNFQSSLWNTLTYSYWRTFRVEWAILDVIYTAKNSEPLGETGSGTFTRYPEQGATDFSRLWRETRPSGRSITSSGRNFNLHLPTILKHNDIDQVTQLRLTLTGAGYEAGTALIYISDGITPQTLVGTIPMGTSVPALRRTVRARIPGDFLAGLDPDRTWTLRLVGTQNWTLYDLEVAADIISSGQMPPSVLRHWPASQASLDPVNQGVLIEMSDPLNPATFSSILIEESVLNPITLQYDPYQAVTRTTQADQSGRLLYIQADEFTHGSRIRVTIPTTVENLFGTGLEEPYSFEFDINRHTSTFRATNIVHRYQMYRLIGDEWVLEESSSDENFTIGLGNTVISDGRSRIDDTHFRLNLPDFNSYHQPMLNWHVHVSGTGDYPDVPFTEIPRIAINYFDSSRLASSYLSVGANRFRFDSSALSEFLQRGGSNVHLDAGPLAPGQGRAFISFADLALHYGIQDLTQPSITNVTSTVAVGHPVPKERSLTLHSSERLDPLSIHADHIQILGIKKPVNPIALEYQPDLNRIVVTPLEAFAPGDTISLMIVSNGVRDTQGNGVLPATYTFEVIDDVPPMPPRGLVMDTTEDGVTLLWSSPSLDAMGYPELDTLTYHVYRMIPPSQQYVRITSTPLTANSFTDTDLTPFRDHYYRVSAIDASGNESDLSEDVKVVPTPAADTFTIPGGTFNYDITWTRDKTIQITGNISIQNGARLTIEEGVTIEIMGNYTLDIDGRLEVMGQPSRPVIFRSGVNPTRGSWGGIIIRNQHSSIIPLLENLEIHHARTGLYLFRSSPEIRNITIKDFTNYGLRLSRSAARIDGIDLADIERYRWSNIGIFIEDNSTAYLSDAVLRWHEIGIDIRNSAPVLEGFLVERTRTAAVSARNLCDFTLLYSTLQLNYGDAVHINAQNTTIEVAMRYNRFLNNAGRAVVALACAANSVIFAENNYWGTDDPHDISHLVHDQSSGNASDGLVSHRNAVDYDLAPLGGPSVLQGSYHSPILLTAADSPYLVSGNVRFFERVEIEAGAEFLVDDDYEIKFDSILVANGTQANPIVFRHIHNDPANNSWRGIILDPGMDFIDSSIRWWEISDAATGLSIEFTSSSITLVTHPFKLRNLKIDNCQTGVRIAGNNNGGSGPWLVDSQIHRTQIGVDLYRTTARVEGCMLEQMGKLLGTGTGIRSRPGDTTSTYRPEIAGNEIRNFSRGIAIYANTHAQITGNVIDGSASRGIYAERRRYHTGGAHGRYVSSRPNPVITGNKITESSQHGLYFGSNHVDSDLNYPASATIEARHNWWGTSDPHQVRALIYDRQQDSGNPIVNYAPFLDAPGGSDVLNVLAGAEHGTNTIRLQHSPYTVVSDYQVYGELIIESGVELVFDEGRKLFLHNQAVINASLSDPVILRSSTEYAGGPNYYRWGGIETTASFNGYDSVLKGLEIRDAATGFRVNSEGEWAPILQQSRILNSAIAVDLYRTSARVEDCVLEQTGSHVGTGTGIRAHPGDTTRSYSPEIAGNEIRNFDTGISIHGNTRAEILGNSIEGSASRGINARRRRFFNSSNGRFYYTWPYPLITGNTITDSGQYALYFSSNNSDGSLNYPQSATIDATGNWWGTADPQQVAALIFDRQQDSGNPIVKYVQFLDAEDGEGVSNALGGGERGTRVLTIQDSPYSVARDYHMFGELIIEPGVELVFDEGRKLFLHNQAVINASLSDPVILRSSTEYAGGPNYYRWGGIETTASFNGYDSVLKGLEIRDAATGFRVNSEGEWPPILKQSRIVNSTVAVDLYRTSARVEDCVLEQTGSHVGTGTGIRAHPGDTTRRYSPEITGNEIRNFDTGISIHGNTNAEITGNVIDGSASWGIYAERRRFFVTSFGFYYIWPYPLISGNAITDSGQYALYFDRNNSDSSLNYPQSATIDATGNWWGTADPQQVAALIYDRQQRSGNPAVDYLPLGTSPENTVFAALDPMTVTSVSPAGELLLTAVYPVSMNTSVIPRATYRHGGEDRDIEFSHLSWNTTYRPNDTIVMANTEHITFTLGNGRHAVWISGAEGADGSTDFLYADNWFYLAIPSDNAGPDISGIQRPANVGDRSHFQITANMSDASRGNNGVWRGVLRGGYAPPHDRIEIEGEGPGGNGDGMWTFSVPAQIGQGGQTFRFTLTAYDHTGRDRTSGQQAVNIITSDLETTRNGLPDWWLMHHFNNLNQTRLADPDNDRIINILEFLMGTNPNNADNNPLRGYWRFDASNAQDSSTWANHGTLTGGAYMQYGVRGGRFLRFSSSDDVLNLGFAPILKSTPMTLTTYFRIQSMPVGDGILWDNLTVSAGMRIAITASGDIRVITRGPEGEMNALVEVSLQAGDWYHLALAVSASTLTLYVNTEPVWGSNLEGRFEAADVFTATTMGNHNLPSAVNHFDGDVDEVMFWTRQLNEREIAIASGIFKDYLGGIDEWRSGFKEGEYVDSDHDNFVWNTTSKTLQIDYPNRAQQTNQPYVYQFTDRQSPSFRFSFETTITKPGFDAPFRFGMKQNPAANWGTDQGFSCTFAFRSTGFSLELFVRDGANNTRTHEWPTGFRLDDPPRWVRGSFQYNHIAETLTFELRDADSDDRLAEHVFGNVKPFAANMARFVVSARGDTPLQSDFQDNVHASLRRVTLHPVPLGTIISDSLMGDEPWREWARTVWGDHTAGHLDFMDDPGDHGVPLIYRYAYGLSGVNPDRSLFPRGGLHQASPGADQYFSLQYQRRVGVEGIDFILEGANQLGNPWIPISNPVILHHETNGETETIILRDAQPMNQQPMRFLRLRLELD